jgi:hypothetical protein
MSDDNAPPEDNPPADDDDSEGSEPLSSPFSTETIKFMVGVDDELLSVLLRGGLVGERRVGLDVAGPFLFRLNELIHAIGAVLIGRKVGARGTLPTVPGAGFLALAGVEWGKSVVFHFGTGAGEVMKLNEPSITEEAVEALAELMSAAAVGNDQALLAATRALGPRVGTNYLSLVTALTHHGVNSYWQPRSTGPAIDLSVPRLKRTKVVLEQEAPPVTFNEVVRGFLYRADSKEHQFVLDRIDEPGEKLVGVYGPELREEIRQAWDKVVEVEIRTTHYFLARQIDPARVEVELLKVLDATDVD